VLLGCIAFAAVGCFIISSPHSPRDRLAGFALVGFCGLGSLVALSQFVPGSSFLRVAPEALTVRSLWRTKFYRWSDIERFGVADFSTVHFGVRQHHRMVGFNLSPSYPGLRKGGTVGAINISLVGFEEALPDNYGIDCAELAEHLDRLRQKYTTTPDSA